MTDSDDDGMHDVNTKPTKRTPPWAPKFPLEVRALKYTTPPWRFASVPAFDTVWDEEKRENEKPSEERPSGQVDPNSDKHGYRPFEGLVGPSSADSDFLYDTQGRFQDEATDEDITWDSTDGEIAWSVEGDQVVYDDFATDFAADYPAYSSDRDRSFYSETFRDCYFRTRQYYTEKQFNLDICGDYVSQKHVGTSNAQSVVEHDWSSTINRRKLSRVEIDEQRDHTYIKQRNSTAKYDYSISKLEYGHQFSSSTVEGIKEATSRAKHAASYDESFSSYSSKFSVSNNVSALSVIQTRDQSNVVEALSELNIFKYKGSSNFLSVTDSNSFYNFVRENGTTVHVSNGNSYSISKQDNQVGAEQNTLIYGGAMVQLIGAAPSCQSKAPRTKAWLMASYIATLSSVIFPALSAFKVLSGVEVDDDDLDTKHPKNEKSVHETSVDTDEPAEQADSCDNYQRTSAPFVALLHQIVGSVASKSAGSRKNLLLTDLWDAVQSETGKTYASGGSEVGKVLVSGEKVTMALDTPISTGPARQRIEVRDNKVVLIVGDNSIVLTNDGVTIEGDLTVSGSVKIEGNLVVADCVEGRSFTVDTKPPQKTNVKAEDDIDLDTGG